MKIKLNKLIFVTTLLCICTISGAQDYKNLVSLRAGVYTGVMAKRLLANESAFAIQLAFRDGGVVASGYRMFHELAFPRKQNYQLFIYYGYGMHIRYFTKYKLHNPFKPWRPDTEFRGNYVAGGFDGILGMEHRFLKYPIVISADISPNFEFGGANIFRTNFDMISVGIGYTF